MWTKSGHYTQQEFHQDMGQCRAQAFGTPGAMQNLLQVAIVLNGCMQGKGWYQVARPVKTTL